MIVVVHKRAEVIPKTSSSSLHPISISHLLHLYTTQSVPRLPKTEKHRIFFRITCVPWLGNQYSAEHDDLLHGSSIFSKSKSHPGWSHQDQQIAFVFPFSATSIYLLLHAQSYWQDAPDQQTNNNHLNWYLFYPCLTQNLITGSLLVNVRWGLTSKRSLLAFLQMARSSMQSKSKSSTHICLSFYEVDSGPIQLCTYSLSGMDLPYIWSATFHQLEEVCPRPDEINKINRRRLFSADNRGRNTSTFFDRDGREV